MTGNFQIGSVIKTCFASLSTEEDAVAVEAFFADKDTSLYNQALLQVSPLVSPLIFIPRLTLTFLRRASNLSAPTPPGFIATATT